MNLFGKILTPSRVLVLGITALILLGAFLLTLPNATQDGMGLSLLDAIFTSTSAVSITGLTVVDTTMTFSLFGQWVILILMQVGGLGFMTFATMFSIILGRRITLKDRLLLKEALNQVSVEGIVRLVKYVVLFTFGIEAFGALILTIRWSFDYSWSTALFYGIFHSISAYNNAGFGLFGQSLIAYAEDPIVNITVMLLIILGGLGFIVLVNLYELRVRKLTLHSKLVLKATGFLILAGAVIILILESANSLTFGELPAGSKVLAAFFQSVTRSAGFNTISIAEMTDTTLLAMMVLMFIGASPGSTGGGIKTTTFVVLFASVLNTFRSGPHVVLEGRTIPPDQIQKAWAITSSGVLIIFLMTSILTITENISVFALLFEVISAFGTVGLSLGVTPNLSPVGKVVIIATMFMGRVGLLTLGFFLSRKARKSAVNIKYPEERILIG